MSFGEKFWQYVHGVILSLCGKFPHEELDQLQCLKINIYQDDRWLCIHHGVAPLTERYVNLCSPGWRKYPVQDIASFRRVLFTKIREAPTVLNETFVPSYDTPSCIQQKDETHVPQQQNGQNGS